LIFLQRLFQNEFSLSDDEAPETVAQNAQSVYGGRHRRAAPRPARGLQPDRRRLPQTQKLRRLSLAAFRVLSGGAAVFPADGRRKHEPPQRLKQIQNLGNRMYKQQEIVYKEASPRSITSTPSTTVSKTASVDARTRVLLEEHLAGRPGLCEVSPAMRHGRVDRPRRRPYSLGANMSKRKEIPS
jgi:hypothetical protein